MAEMVKSINVEIMPKLTVDLETAQVCVKLLNWFLESDDRYRLALAWNNDEGGKRWELTDEPVTLKTTMDELSATAKAAVDAADAEMQRKKFRKLARLEDE
ncbi:MAG: hypothetical protein IJ092_06360 [Atopobiaceae bacterium]|nr:hypothetical protein [Atopobiaceae bacterium]